MMKPVFFVVSTDNPTPPVFSNSIAEGLLEPVRQDRLTGGMIAGASALITCAAVDQIDLMEKREAIAKLLDAGGRMVINGHVLRPYVKGLSPFAPLRNPRRDDYRLTRLSDHPVFAGISAQDLETSRGVAGFYGRGYNPPPPEAVVLTGLGPAHFPVDWVWSRPEGGALFVHAGNDLWGVGDDPGTKRLIAERFVRWCLAGQLAEARA